MDPTWLDHYPRAAAMLQGDDDVLLYDPRETAAPPVAPGMFGPVPVEVREAVASLEAVAAALCDWIDTETERLTRRRDALLRELQALDEREDLDCGDW